MVTFFGIKRKTSRLCCLRTLNLVPSQSNVLEKSSTFKLHPQPPLIVRESRPGDNLKFLRQGAFWKYIVSFKVFFASSICSGGGSKGIVGCEWCDEGLAWTWRWRVKAVRQGRTDNPLILWTSMETILTEEELKPLRLISILKAWSSTCRDFLQKQDAGRWRTWRHWSIGLPMKTVLR